MWSWVVLGKAVLCTWAIVIHTVTNTLRWHVSNNRYDRVIIYRESLTFKRMQACIICINNRYLSTGSSSLYATGAKDQPLRWLLQWNWTSDCHGIEWNKVKAQNNGLVWWPVTNDGILFNRLNITKRCNNKPIDNDYFRGWVQHEQDKALSQSSHLADGMECASIFKHFLEQLGRGCFIVCVQHSWLAGTSQDGARGIITFNPNKSMPTRMEGLIFEIWWSWWHFGRISGSVGENAQRFTTICSSLMTE